MVVSDVDTYRIAHILIRENGEDAPAHAAKRHDALAEAGDHDGCALWKRIMRAIDEQLSKEPLDGAGVH